MRKFDGKIVIVTDGGGIGGATCRRFAQQGARVAVFDMTASLRTMHAVLHTGHCQRNWGTGVVKGS
jgi:NAD(P)-dependent dehydrogenase (short-subunit alcohol dehydrogenase family)